MNFILIDNITLFFFFFFHLNMLLNFSKFAATTVYSLSPFKYLSKRISLDNIGDAVFLLSV